MFDEAEVSDTDRAEATERAGADDQQSHDSTSRSRKVHESVALDKYFKELNEKKSAPAVEVDACKSVEDSTDSPIRGNRNEGSLDSTTKFNTNQKLLQGQSIDHEPANDLGVREEADESGFPQSPSAAREDQAKPQNKTRFRRKRKNKDQ